MQITESVLPKVSLTHFIAQREDVDVGEKNVVAVGRFNFLRSQIIEQGCFANTWFANNGR